MRFLPIRKACLSLLALSLLLCELPLLANAEVNHTEDFQTWQIGTVQGHITKRILYYLDTQNNEINLTDKRGNSTNNNTHEGQLLVRPAIGLEVTKGWSIWQGYGWTPSYQPQFRNENQIWEQALYRHNFKHFAISNRTRLEMRWIENTNGQTAVRFRNQFRLAIPLGKSRWSIVAFDEPFFNLNSVPTGPRQGFNQNWAFLGIERRMSKAVNLYVGYLNNYVRNFRPVPDRINNVIFVSLNINMPGTGFDLHKPAPSNAPVKSSSSRLPTMPMTIGQADDTQGMLPVSQPNLEIAPITQASAVDKNAALESTPVSEPTQQGVAKVTTTDVAPTNAAN